MLLVRPVSMDDLDALVDLAASAGVGLTTLPPDRELLARRIQKSQRSIERIPDRPGGETYLFVLQEADSGRVVGASGIVSKVGGFEPFYAYQVTPVVHESKQLGVHKEIPTLHLVREHDGPAEIGSLFLHEQYRRKDNGRFLQLVRFLFLAEHPEAFAPQVVSELRGVIDATGRSPFWDAVGRHFFDIEFPRADYLSVVNKRFIADLMPAHPIYIPMLPADAQAVIGKAHDGSRPALKNLEAEGFRFCGMVDIFDAGPCVCCARDDIRVVRESRSVVVAEVLDLAPEEAPYMLCSAAEGFRACLGNLWIGQSGSVRITLASARALGVATGGRIRYASLRPAKPADGAAVA